MKCLLVINPQNGWLHAESRPAFDMCRQLLTRFEQVAISQFFNRNPLFESQLNWTRFREAPDTDLLEGFVDPAFFVFEQTGLGVFSDVFRDYLQRNSIDTIYLAGVFTDVSIAKAAMDGFDLGYSMYVVMDACATLHGQDVHTSALKSIRQALGPHQVVSSTQL